MSGAVYVGTRPTMLDTLIDRQGNVLDVSGFTTLNCKVKKGGGTTFIVGGALVSGGADGKVRATWPEADVTEGSDYVYYWDMVLPSGPFKSDPVHQPVIQLF